MTFTTNLHLIEKAVYPYTRDTVLNAMTVVFLPVLVFDCSLDNKTALSKFSIDQYQIYQFS